MAPQIDNPHDWAIWLLDNLESQHQAAPGLMVGTLPPEWNFDEVITALGPFDSLLGLTDEALRTIEFRPGSQKVYANLGEMFGHPNNLKTVPARFTLRDINFTYDAAAVAQGTLVVPPLVATYLDAAKLCALLSIVADMTAHNGMSLHFIKSPESRLEVKLVYELNELTQLTSLGFFETEFAVTTHHKDQKRSIIRTVILDAFKGQRAISVGAILPKFEAMVEDIRSNYAMYAAEFSFEKIKAEVEKDNLDSTLKLNKTLSEIQNQLLAMPVALVLVGGQMTPDTGVSIKNVVIWLGACVFAGLMVLLMRNQRHAIDAITEEIRLRKIKVDAQPDGIAGKFKTGFDDLQKRAQTQIKTLRFLRYGVVGSVVLATVLLAWFSVPAWHKTPVAAVNSGSVASASAPVASASAAAATGSLLGSSSPAASSPPVQASPDLRAASAPASSASRPIK